MGIAILIGRSVHRIMNVQRDQEIIKRIFKSNRSDTLVVIPARSGSKRFPDKNIYEIDNSPLMIRAAKEALKMKNKPRVIISTDSDRYYKICQKHNIEYDIRKPFLGCDSAPKQAVIADTCLNLYERERYLPNYVISLQANSPDVKASDLDNIFKHHLVDNKYVYKETISINKNGDQNGAIRIMNIATVFQESLSTYLTTYKINLRDVHHFSDL